MEYTTFKHHSKPRIHPVSKRLTAKTLSFISLMIGPSRGERMRPTNEQSSKKIRKEARTFGRRASQRHTKTFRNHETGNAAGRTQRCGHLRFHFGGGGITSSPPAFLPTPSLSPCVSTATSCAIIRSWCQTRLQGLLRPHLHLQHSTTCIQGDVLVQPRFR